MKLNQITKLLLITGLSTLLPTTTFAFPDTQNHWANKCIDQLAATVGFRGYPDGTFRPNSPVTRAEFAAMILTSFNTRWVKSPRDPLTFKDVPSSHWAYRAITDTSARSWFSGYPDGTFRPSQPITRTEAMVVLRSILDFTAPEEPETMLPKYFDDATEIPNYAQQALADAAIGRIIVNHPDVRKFKPQQNATRAEISASLCQALWFARVLPLEYVARVDDPFDLPPEIGGIGAFTEGLSLTRLGSKYGYMNKQGEIVIEPQFDFAGSFVEGLAIARKDDDIFYINKTGEVAFYPPDFTSGLSNFSEGLVVLRLRETNQNGVIDKQGNLVFQTEHFIRSFSEGLALFTTSDRKHGFVDTTGKVVIAPQPYELSSFYGGRASILKDGEYGFIDQTGNIVIEPQFAEIQPFSEGLAAVKVGEMWGFIDSQGNQVIAPQFDTAQSFSEGLAGVSKDGKWFYINPQGAVAIQGDFRVVEYAQKQAIEPFSGGVAAVRLGERAGFIDQTGKFVIAPQFVDVSSFRDGVAAVNVGGRWTTEVTGINIPPDFPTRATVVGGRWGSILLPIE